MDEKYPSQRLAKFQMRLPDQLHELLREAAERNNRSMNAEIVNRLSESTTGGDIIQASEAAERAEKARANQAAALRRSAACAVRDAADTGHRYATISTAGTSAEVIGAIADELRHAGYQVETEVGRIRIEF